MHPTFNFQFMITLFYIQILLVSDHWQLIPSSHDEA